MHIPGYYYEKHSQKHLQISHQKIQKHPLKRMTHATYSKIYLPYNHPLTAVSEEINYGIMEIIICYMWYNSDHSVTYWR